MSGPSPATSNDPAAAVVTCVEAGILEPQTIRMIESLRRWGGRLAGVPVIAVTPRFGPAISSATRRRYDQLNVTYVRCPSTSQYGWYNFMNKCAAVLAAERVGQFDSLIWLDADILVVAEPTDFILKDTEDFTACPTEKNIAITPAATAADRYFDYWQAMCKAVGLSVNQLPVVNEFRHNEPIRVYFNGGVFSYRPASGYAQAYLEATERILDARIQLKDDGIFYHEQAAVGLAMVKHNVRWRVLAESHNYHFGSSTREHVDPEKFKTARVLHYHRSMQRDRWDAFVDCFTADYPAVRDWLAPLGPLGADLPFFKRALSKLLRDRRKKLTDQYRATCRVT